jgi:hypothetical protein
MTTTLNETVTVETMGMTISRLVWRRFRRPMPGMAERILGLSPRAQARELAKLEISLSQKAAPVTPVSKAPAPVKPIGAKSTASDGLSDKDNIADWMKKRQREANGR